MHREIRRDEEKEILFFYETLVSQIKRKRKRRGRRRKCPGVRRRGTERKEVLC